MATVYRLFDLGYTVYVISDNILELPVEQTDGMKQFMVNDLLPKMHVNVISLDDALHALGDRE